MKTIINTFVKRNSSLLFSQNVENSAGGLIKILLIHDSQKKVRRNSQCKTRDIRHSHLSERKDGKEA